MLKSRIKVKLAEVGMKAQDLSMDVEVTKQTMSAWMNDRSSPSLEAAFKVARRLNCKVDDLFVYIEDVHEES